MELQTFSAVLLQAWTVYKLQGGVTISIPQLNSGLEDSYHNHSQDHHDVVHLRDINRPQHLQGSRAVSVHRSKGHLLHSMYTCMA